MRRALLLAGLLLGLAAPAAPAALPPVRHVFVVVLENKDFDQSFGAQSPGPYLASTLTAGRRTLRACRAIHLRLHRRHGVVHLRLPGARNVRLVRY